MNERTDKLPLPIAPEATGHLDEEAQRHLAESRRMMAESTTKLLDTWIGLHRAEKSRRAALYALEQAPPAEG